MTTSTTTSPTAIAKSFTVPKGFKFGAVAAGVKQAGASRRDVALIVSEAPCAAAGTFTVNRMRAAPCDHGAGCLPASGIRAIVANSGNANAIVGPRGAKDERAVAAAVAAALGVEAEAVLSASTGAIGVPLPVDRIAAAVPALVAALGDDAVPAAEAIRTTDLRTKAAFREIDVGGTPVKFAAIAKGSGMIHPQMATMLCFITTDATVAPAVLQAALAEAVEETFNTITVDGDMSTNDTVIALANGRAGAPAIERDSAGYTKLQATLVGLCGELARAIAADGEGATKLLIVDVAGVPEHAVARDLARAVAGGSLVKSGIFGGDPSWGRILAALGARIGARNLPLDLTRVTLDIQGVRVYGGGEPVAFDAKTLSALMKKAEIAVRLDLGLGKATARALGCDLTFDYVKINAEYYTGTAAPGEPAKRAAVGSNRPLVVEALSYIRRFGGKRAVIKYGGAAMVDPALKRSFAEEVVLLQSAGLKPVIVHGGGPEITKTLEKMGRKSEFADGQRITGKEEVQVVEMVLTGRINTEIVGLINSLGGNAIGLSGKDGRLLTAHKLETPPGKPDLGFVGEIESVNADLLDMFLERGYMPVISPVGFGMDGSSYNINADVAAGEIAAACGAERLIFLTDVAGILDDDGTLISEIRAADLEARLGGSIRGGMHVKVQAVLHALASGVRAVHVVDGRQPHSIVAELFTDRGVGTLVT
ncbi:MAG TPA: bifunctional glutamate N-acetyltransferase/amino-acid acetyltransferase ArgJ [Polyangia bacterium]|nr:bifunctional glutamate N-acetyltransferase/amino-acid acetyltransferase ArgJ [Polyangia bacterium]